jgi:hypothetical protein
MNNLRSDDMQSTAAIEHARILLAYVYYPVTTAVYFERALRQRHQVVTIGPKMDESLITTWHLENMKLPILDQNIPSVREPDMRALWQRLPEELRPDLYLWVESVGGHFPVNLDALKIPKACYLIDSHLNLQWHVEWAKHFDHVFIAQREYLEAFRASGNRSVHWLPLGCDPEIHRQATRVKQHDVGFVGSLNTERRVALLNRVETCFRVVYERSFWVDMADFFARCRIVFNNAIKNDLNMRVFEVLSTGSFLLTDAAENSGQEVLFHDREELGMYNDEAIREVVGYYLEHEEERERIAARGRTVAHAAHTYAHRLEDLLAVVLGGKSDTYTAEELRERSTRGMNVAIPSRPVPVPVQLPKAPCRSFVIPVLDMSPASPYNITTLLTDLQKVEGDVIVVFNSEEMAARLKGHPRIDYSAVMSHNVGVARAWNIGLAMSEAPVTFILNADVHIEPEAVDAMERGLAILPDAAVVGPQGSFYQFETLRDILYLEKGATPVPVEVDAVSGFLFAVKTDLFARQGLQFDGQYTPCYMEEWDIGLQCRQHGWKCYVVPTTAFDHEWSGSIRALRTIPYMRREETSFQILERNRVLFKQKWARIARSTGTPGLLRTLWPSYGRTLANKLQEQGKRQEAENLRNDISAAFPGEKVLQ